MADGFCWWERRRFRRGIFVGKVFIGANGVDAEHGLTAFHPDEAAFNAVMVEQVWQEIPSTWLTF
jgi:DeoR/GlpR family transcriptional regulator of sugar metabolism